MATRAVGHVYRKRGSNDRPHWGLETRNDPNVNKAVHSALTTEKVMKLTHYYDFTIRVFSTIRVLPL